MRRWIAPLIAGLVVMLLAYEVALTQTPTILMRLAVGRVADAGGYNTLAHAPLATAQSRAIVRPSPDLAYSSCPYDVSKGPVLVEVAPVAAPYWSLSVFDSHTDTAFVRNNLQANGQPIKVAILGDGQTAPAGYEAVPVKGALGVALVRILVPNRAEFAAIDTARRASICRKL
ncbi:hypothetical protein BH09PSE4_BH09PSE4_21890 [soil metagenome]